MTLIHFILHTELSNLDFLGGGGGGGMLVPHVDC